MDMADLFTPIELFREALAFTSRRYGFPARLIEKDYVATLVLKAVAGAHSGLVFKGGTCLAKVYADFYRMSEDLDFVISMPVKTSRAARREQAKTLKDLIAGLPAEFPFVRVVEPMTGTNNSTQYNAAIGYSSSLGGRDETIKIEVGLREPLVQPAVDGEAKTILLDPVTGEPLIPPTNITCISRPEAFAEKFRAALSRREPAVRDFFDLDYAVRTLGLKTDDAELIALVADKVQVPGNDPVNISAKRLSALRQQVEPQLRPVLRTEDFRAFDIDRAFAIVSRMADRLGTRP
jgi:predicted nucleotidyltransferase component of viral defense system